MSFDAYAVWTFVLNKMSGPRRMTVQIEGTDHVGILQDECVFTPSMHISSVAIALNDKLFRMYFDKDMHGGQNEDNVYVVLRLRSNMEAMSIDLNKDMPDIVELFGW